ncbi:MAG: glycerol-3-phosphate acyltransferase [Chloroflexota bacterium]|nr:glycerol-3-phosphate acyltransferase [Chloroflexota bacterium]
MIVNQVVTGVIGIIIGYLLGTIPSAYLMTRLVTGKDIRNLGGGNIGGLNTYREVGTGPAAIVALVDLSKGAASVAIAYYLLDLPLVFVLLAGLFAVIGHNWMVWLKFSGGRGMGPAIGAVTMAIPLYGHAWGLLYFYIVIVIPLVATRNVALSMGTGLLSLPLIVWLTTQSGTATLMAAIMGLIIGGKFYPTAKKSWTTAKSKKDFVFDRSLKKR